MSEYAFDSGGRELNPKDFKYGEGWTEQKEDGKTVRELNVSKLDLDSQIEYFELVGTLFDLTSTPVKKNILRVRPWSYEQLEFFARRLEVKKDYRRIEAGDGGFFLYFRNPSLTYFYTNPLPTLGPSAVDAFIRGIITSSIEETINRKGKHDKIVWQSRLLPVVERVRAHLDERRIIYETDDVPPRRGQGKARIDYTTWVLDNQQVKDWILPEFDHLPGQLDRLTDYSTPEMRETVYFERIRLRQIRNVDYLYRLGLLDINRSEERIRELQRAKQVLREVRYGIKELKSQTSTIESFTEQRPELMNGKQILEEKKKELEEKIAELEELLYLDKEARKGKRRKYSGDWQARATWKDSQARRRAGEF